MRATIVALSIALFGCMPSIASDAPPDELVLAGGTTGRLAATQPEGRRRAPWIEVAPDRATFHTLWTRYVPGDPDEALSRVDFGRDVAVFLLLGPQETGGYAIEPIGVQVDGAVIKVRARLVQPMKPDDFSAQVITAPYAVVKAPAIVFDRVEWIDADGRTLATRTKE